MALPKLYERVHISKFKRLAALGRTLAESCNEDRPSGYGEWTRQLFWNNKLVFRGQLMAHVAEAISIILQHTPKLNAFSPSPQQWASHVPTEVWDTLFTKPKPFPLKVLHLLGGADLAEIVKLIRCAPSLTSITLGLPWSALGERDLPLPHLRRLHVDCYSDRYSHIQEFTFSELPSLEQLTITFRGYSSEPELLVRVHGRKLKFLHLKTSKNYLRVTSRPPHVDSFLDHCPNLTHLIADWRLFSEGIETIERNSKLVRLGLTGYGDLIHTTSDYPPPLPPITFPKSLESVRILDAGFLRGIGAQDIPHLRNHLREWQGKIRIEEDPGLF